MITPKEQSRIGGAAILTVILTLIACNRPVPTPQTQPEAAVRQTAAAVTLEAQLTAIASGNFPTVTVIPATPASGQGPSPAPTQSATAQSGTSAPTGTAQAGVCDMAEFVADVTVPDGTDFQPGETFDKTWRFKNTGTCEWNTNYSLVFVDGDSMNGPAVVTLTNSFVAPGEEVDVTVSLTAPFVPGTYRGNWKFRNASGAIFGVGSDGEKDFWVEIEVVGETTPTAEE
jgi:hypothetical protein